MLGTRPSSTVSPTPRTRRTPPRALAAPPPAPALCAALSALGDAVAVLDQPTQSLCWASQPWLDLWPGLGVGASPAALEAAFPGLAAALGLPDAAGEPASHSVGDRGQWTLHLAALSPTQQLLRLADRREQGLAVQRQLDDREQLLFTSRVISVGEMASTLAHELNQPIGATANLLRALRQRLSRRHPALDADEAAALDRAIEQVMFAAKVIARIREFTHSHQPRFARVDLVALLRASASLLDWDVARTGAQVTIEVLGEPVLVRGDEVMLQQVMVNLVRNALDALRSNPPQAPLVQLRLIRGEADVELQVRDNGCGLGDEAAARLFVPFASTKPNGMGIGLSICRSFVELHQGRLWFSRNPERGATFHMSLPLHTQS